MQKLIYTLGLPASGKSTWAKQMVRENSNYKRVNKDDLRAMLDCSKWSKENEKFIVETQNLIIRKALLEGKSVIVDDTNFGSYHPLRFKGLVDEVNQIRGNNDVILECNMSFLSTPIELCISRDSQRMGVARVGREVIEKMYNQFIAK